MRLDHLMLTVCASLAVSGCTISANEGPPSAGRMRCLAPRCVRRSGSRRPARDTFAAPIRIIDPDDVVTQDFDSDRINFVIGRDGRVSRVYCG